MIEAGIEDPESLEGKRFCTKRCPYPVCVVYEEYGNKQPQRYEKAETRARAIKILREEGKSKKEIAKILNVSLSLVYRYYREKNL